MRLINGRPIAELKLDRRQVAMVDGAGVVKLASADERNLNGVVEFADVVRPVPVADANGWYLFADVHPDIGQLVVTRAANGYWGVVTWSSLSRVAEHWKPLEAPVAAPSQVTVV